jgi:hypothetical protein
MIKNKVGAIAAIISGSVLVGSASVFSSGTSREFFSEQNSARREKTYSFYGTLPIANGDLKNYDFSKKVEDCCGVYANLFSVRFNSGKVDMDLKKATMALAVIPVQGKDSNKFENSPIILKKILKERRRYLPIAESKIVSVLREGDPFVYFVRKYNDFVRKHNDSLESQDDKLELIEILVLDICDGNRFGFYKNFFQKLTVYGTNGHRAEWSVKGHSDDSIQKILKEKDIYTNIRKGENRAILVRDWKNHCKKGKLLFFITYGDNLYWLEFFGNGEVVSGINWKKYALGAGVAIGAGIAIYILYRYFGNGGQSAASIINLTPPQNSQQPHKGMFLENVINRWSGNSKDKNKGMFLERGFNWLLGNK